MLTRNYRGLAYLAGPYTHPDPSVMEQRFTRMNHFAARLIEAGWPVFSPITHSHPIALHMPPEENNWATWIAQDYAILEKCSRVFCLMADGWRESQGVSGELDFCRRNEIPIVYLEDVDELTEGYPGPLQISTSYPSKNDGAHAKFWCWYCGNEYGSAVRRPAKSCGCLRSRKASDRAKMRNTTHGRTDSPTYRSWSAMMQRCYNKRHTYFQHYGGRGIAVCDDWLNFENFYEDMGERPDGTSLDRIDNSKGYSPTNCRWSTRLEQNRNRSCSHTVLGWTDEEVVYGKKRVQAAS